MTQQEFITVIAPLCVKYAQKYGFKVVSPAIAQACLESAYGTSPKAKHHNYFGLKYRPNRLTVNTGTFVDGGSEQQANGAYVPITAQWFNFDNMEKGVEGYYQFINIPAYAKVKAATNPAAYLQEIKNAGYATSKNYVQNNLNVIIKWNLTAYDNLLVQSAMVQPVAPVPAPAPAQIKGRSSLINYVKLSPNNSGLRTHTIDRITPHCIVGQWTVENIGNYFANPAVKASCNYGIAKDGKVALVVEETMRSWCSSSNPNDQRAVTIECASEKTAPYAFNDVVYNKLVDLCADICKRNGKNVLLWIPDKNQALAYNPKANEMLLTVHRWFKTKACPGDWLMARMGDLASRVTVKLGGNAVQPIQTTPVTPVQGNKVPYQVQVLPGILNVRKGPSLNDAVTMQITDRGKYTIIEEKDGFGLLKAYAKYRNGWVSLKYVKKI